jgi:hypothetical protein
MYHVHVHLFVCREREREIKVNNTLSEYIFPHQQQQDDQ